MQQPEYWCTFPVQDADNKEELLIITSNNSQLLQDNYLNVV